MTVSQAAQERTRKRKPEKKSGALHEFAEIIKTVVWALGIALVLRVLLFQPFTIPSASMEPALYQGDYIIVSKFSYGWSRHSVPFSPPLFEGRVLGRAPARGDIAVFKLPRDDRTDYIKRVIGLPGDRIQVRDGRVYVNGTAAAYQVVGPPAVPPDCSTFAPPPGARVLTERLPNGFAHAMQDCFERPDAELDPVLLDETGRPRVYVVPAGHYFMMGDNRDNSIDSRYPEAYGVGFVPEENLVGKAEVILLSWTADAALAKPWTWFSELRFSRFFKRLS